MCILLAELRRVLNKVFIMYGVKSIECDWCFVPMKRVSTEDYSHYYICPCCKETIPGERFDEYEYEWGDYNGQE